MKKKQLITILAVLTMLAATACGNNNGENSDSGSSNASTQLSSGESAEASGASDAASQEAEAFSYPLTDVTLTVNMDTDPYDMTEYPYIAEENFFWNVLKEKTGVTLNNFGPTPEAYVFDEDFLVMLLSGDLPDLLWANWVEYPGGPAAAIEEGYIIPLNDYAEYMPNLMAYLEANPELANQVTLDDGTIFCFPFVRDIGMQIETGAVIRQDWLDEQNLAVPATVEEWHDTLAALKQAYNLPAPLTFESRWFFLEYAMAPISSAYETTYPFYIADDKVHFGPLEENYKEFIAEMARWNAEGLIDPDMPTVDKSTVTSKMASGECAISINQLGKITSCLNSNEGTDYKLSPVPSAVSVVGEEPKMSHYRNSYNGSYSISVSTSCEDIEAACRFLDYAYGEEGSMLYNYGTEGISYELNGDSVKFLETVTDNADVTANSARNAYGHYFNWAMVSRDYSILLDEESRKIQSGWYANMEDYAYPTVNHTPQEQQILSDYWTNIDDYCREMILKFVIGSESMDNWDDFVATLQSTYHVEEVLKVKQDAYDRYISK